MTNKASGGLETKIIMLLLSSSLPSPSLSHLHLTLNVLHSLLPALAGELNAKLRIAAHGCICYVPYVETRTVRGRIFTDLV